LQVYVYPETSINEKEFPNVLGKLNVALHTGKARQHQLTGHQFSTVGPGRASAFATWAFSFSAGEKILSIIPRPSGPVASLGKVLGNRTTLYKYLNPHLFAVTTVSPTTCGVYLIDAAKGSIAYHASITASQNKGRCDLHATFVENWLVYVYWDEEYQWVEQTKSHRLVTVELYEGSMPDDKTRRCVH
jgi:ER membrane protein complex subunit 1